MRLPLAACSCLVFLLVSAGLARGQAKGDPKAGKEKYDSLCGSCHGANGKGDGPAAVSLNPKPQNHTDGKYMNTLGEKYLFDFIKAGGVGVGKSPLMPAWANTLKDDDVWNLVAYIRTLAKPPYKPPK